MTREAIVSAGEFEVPLRRAGNNAYLQQPKTKLGVGGATPVKSDLDNAQMTTTPPEMIQAVAAKTTPANQTRPPP